MAQGRVAAPVQHGRGGVPDPMHVQLNFSGSLGKQIPRAVPTGPPPTWSPLIGASGARQGARCVQVAGPPQIVCAGAGR
eukprot:15457452-Alexandrium_andersonii.AAC.1